MEHIQELSSLIIPTRDFHLLSSLNILSCHQALHALLIHFERKEKYEEGKDSLKWKMTTVFVQVTRSLGDVWAKDKAILYDEPLLRVHLPVLKGLLFLSPIQTGFVATPSLSPAT